MVQGKWLVHWLKAALIWAVAITAIVFGSTSISLGRPSISIPALVILLAWSPVMATLRLRRDFVLPWRRSGLPLLLCFLASTILACAALALRGSPSNVLSRLGLALLIGVICSGVGLVPLRWLVPTYQSSRHAP
jgi:predicted RND superfamily exporter protein